MNVGQAHGRACAPRDTERDRQCLFAKRRSVERYQNCTIHGQLLPKLVDDQHRALGALGDDAADAAE